jgi:ribose transport system substrate-binding protein
MKWIGSIVAAAICGALVLGGVSSCEKAPEAGQQVFVMVPKGVHPYYGPCWQGFQDAAKKLGVTAEQATPKEFELPQQVEVLENIIAKKPAGIAISAVDDEGLKNVIDKATSAGIKVVTFDAPAPSTKALAYIGTLNPEAGYQAGLKVAELLHNEGEVAILQGGLGTPNLNDRYEGFKKALAEKAPNIKIVAREDTQGKLDLAVTKTENILTSHPNVKAIFGISAECVPGSAAVMKRLNTKGVILAGFDDSPETIAAIKEGTCSFCIAQKTYKMGYLALEKLKDATEGKTLEKQYDTGVIFVTKDNVDTYMKDVMAEFQQGAAQPASSQAAASQQAATQK